MINLSAGLPHNESARSLFAPFFKEGGFMTFTESGTAVVLTSQGSELKQSSEHVRSASSTARSHTSAGPATTTAPASAHTVVSVEQPSVSQPATVTPAIDTHPPVDTAQSTEPSQPLSAPSTSGGAHWHTRHVGMGLPIVRLVAELTRSYCGIFDQPYTEFVASEMRLKQEGKQVYDELSASRLGGGQAADNETELRRQRSFHLRASRAASEGMRDAAHFMVTRCFLDVPEAPPEHYRGPANGSAEEEGGVDSAIVRLGFPQATETREIPHFTARPTPEATAAEAEASDAAQLLPAPAEEGAAAATAPTLRSVVVSPIDTRAISMEAAAPSPEFPYQPRPLQEEEPPPRPIAPASTVSAPAVIVEPLTTTTRTTAAPAHTQANVATAASSGLAAPASAASCSVAASSASGVSGTAETAKAPLSGFRILVVDDERGIRLSNERTLKRLGAEVELATDGDEVVPMLRQAHVEARPFNAVLMDIIMRRVNGDLACQQAREAGFTSLPIIAASGNVGPADLAGYAARGLSDTLAKPFNSKQLTDTMLKHLRRPAHAMGDC